MIANENSVFPVLILDASHGWDSLLALVKPDLDVRGLSRLKRGLGAKTQSVVVERHYIDKDYRDTYSNFHSKRFSTPSSRCVRLHFFARPVTEEEIAAGGSGIADAYLGYSVIRPTRPNCIGRTFLSHKTRADQSAHLALCKERINLLGNRLDAEGFPFISQDADATVCAESALWMLLRYYSNRYPLYSEIFPFQITRLAASHAVGRRIYPSGGLFSWQLAEALRLQRFSPLVYSRKQYDDSFEHLLYTYVESGLPLLVTVPGHVVACYGHSSDYTVAPPLGGSNFIYTSAFNQSFIVNDDNHHPYQSLRRAGLISSDDSNYDWSKIEEFIVPLPEKVFLAAEQAQTAIEAVLNDSRTGIDALSPRLQARSHVRRLFLTSARSFKYTLRKRGMGNAEVEKFYRRLPIPHFIWVCELAEVDEYRQEKKILGEVIWDATRNAHEPDGWIALHYPEVLLADVGSALNRPQQIVKMSLTDSISYLLFESNLQTI